MSSPWILDRPKFILFGDSITQRGFDNGWVASLANHYIRKADVFNRGFSGYNTRWAKHLLPTVFKKATNQGCCNCLSLALSLSLSPSLRGLIKIIIIVKKKKKKKKVVRFWLRLSYKSVQKNSGPPALLGPLMGVVHFRDILDIFFDRCQG